MNVQTIPTSSPRAKKLPEQVSDAIRTIQELLKNKDVKITMIYAHILQLGGRAFVSLIDGWDQVIGEKGSGNQVIR